MRTVVLNIKKIIAVLVLMLIGQSTLKSQPKDLKIDSLMQFCYENGAFNGTILVIEKGNIIFHKAFGFANPVTKEPLKINSSFYLGSLSKQFTAMAIMILKSQNKLSYNDKLQKYFPELPEYASRITLKHMLTHTSGLADYYNLRMFKPGFTNSDVLKVMLQQTSPDFAPGEKYNYSNSAYVLLALIVEKISGLSFSSFLKQNIFAPLGMNSTVVVDETMPQIPNRVNGFNLIGELDDYNAFTTGGGGMYSTTGDLYLWNQALHTNKLINRDALDEAFSPMVLNDGTISNYGYGWMIEYNDQGKSIYHTGSLAGFRSYIFTDLKKQFTIIMLTNNGEANALKAIRSAVQGFMCNSSANKILLPVSLKLFKQAEINSIENVINTYHELVKTRNDKFDLSEEQLNSLGYMLLMKKRYEEAVFIFRMNLEIHPELVNP